MKKLLFIFALLFTFTATAQTAYEKAKVLDNISVSVVGGATTPLDFNSVFPLNGVAGLKLQKDFTPIFGVNVEGIASFGDNHYGNASTAVRSINTGINGVVNLSNLLCDYQECPRFFELSTETGLGWLHSWTGHSNYLTAKTGLVASFNLTETHSIIVNPTVYWNLSKTDKIQFNKNHAQLGLLVGYTYHFVTSNGTHAFKTYNIEAMNEMINHLHAQLAEKPTEVVREVIRETVKTDTVTIGRPIICFAQNSSDLTDAAKAILDQIPSGSAVYIVAEASPEGTAEYNQMLSENRANTIARYLSNRGVVIKSATGIGTTNSASNRVATITIE